MVVEKGRVLTIKTQRTSPCRRRGSLKSPGKKRYIDRYNCCKACCKATYTRQGPVTKTGLSSLDVSIIDEYHTRKKNIQYNINANLEKCSQVCEISLRKWVLVQSKCKMQEAKTVTSEIWRRRGGDSIINSAADQRKNPRLSRLSSTKRPYLSRQC